MQLSYLYKNRNDKIYFTDCNYQIGRFKYQNVQYHKKKRMKEIKIDDIVDKRNIMML